MSVFRTLRVTRSVLNHCRSQVYITRNIGALSVLQHGKFAGEIHLSQDVGHFQKSGVRVQQRRWLASDSEGLKPVDYDGLVALLESGDIQLVDVREPDELIEYGKIPKSYNIPLSRMKKSLRMDAANFIEQYGNEMPMKWDINIVFYGMGPIMSRAAVEISHKAGYMKARHYPGGWEEWSDKQGLPFRKDGKS